MVKPNFENTVAELFEYKGYENFLPLVPEVREWSDRRKVVNCPLFPRYVFCRFQFDRRVPILNTPGVVKIVSFGNQPSCVPKEEIDTLRSVMASQVHPVRCDYIPSGQRVRVNSGPLAGTEGIFIEAKSGCRIVISIHLLQRSAYVEIDRQRIVMLPDPPSARAAMTAYDVM